MSKDEFEQSIKDLSDLDKNEMRKLRKRLSGEMSPEEIKNYEGWTDDEWDLLQKKNELQLGNKAEKWCEKHDAKLSPEGECWAHEQEMWQAMQDSFGENLKCPYDQNKVKSSDADTDYWNFTCIKCFKSFRIMCCSECGTPDCNCGDNYDDYEPCDGCKNSPFYSPRLYCQGGGRRG